VQITQKDIEMPFTVAMYDKSFDHIGERLEALALDLQILTFDSDGQLRDNGVAVSAAETEIDYAWLSFHFKADGAEETGFDLMLSCKSIGVLQTFNAGLDHPFYKKISDKGTRICNSSAQAVGISEYVLAQVMSVIHPIEDQRKLQAEKNWLKTPFRELSRTNWLIVGFGPIGKEIAKRVKPFGASLSVIRRTPGAVDNVDKVGTLADMDALVSDADIIVLACPLNDQTRGFANDRFFSMVKQNAVLVNIARGPLIDDAAMISSLDKGQLATAILDVFDEEPLPTDNPLWSHPKVHLTAHTSFAGEGVYERWDQLFLDNIACFVKGKALVNEVDPDIIV
jgi:phosphoglycerate dehydrogenase-like enzyme